MAFSHHGFLGNVLKGKALEIGVCATASSGFFLLGYDRESFIGHADHQHLTDHSEGVMSGIITEPNFLQVFPQMDQNNKSGAIQALVVVCAQNDIASGVVG